jgi:hypothetical protein
MSPADRSRGRVAFPDRPASDCVRLTGDFRAQVRVTNEKGGVRLKDQLELQIVVAKDIDGIEMGVLQDGTAYLSGRSLARLCGVVPSTIVERAAEWREGHRDGKVARHLAAAGIIRSNLYIEVPDAGPFTTPSRPTGRTRSPCRTTDASPGPVSASSSTRRSVTTTWVASRRPGSSSTTG